MSQEPQLPQTKTSDNEYVHIRCLIANIHKPRNVSRPPVYSDAPLEVVRESPTSSDTDRSRSGSIRSDISEKPDLSEISSVEEVPPTQRAKSNSFAGAMLAPPLNKRRRLSFLHLNIGGGNEHIGPLSAGPHLNVPRFTVTAPPGEHRRHSHGFPFHGFALRRHSNTSLHRSESMVSLACFKTLSQLVNNDGNELQNYLSTNRNINIDDRDENGTTALMCASESGRVAAVRLLLGASADACAADNDGWTSLAFAARGGHLTIVQELLDAGAQVDSRDCGGWTPLLWASYKGHEEVVALLLEKGADVHAHGNYNINSLVWAAGRRHSGVVARLLAAGARPNSCDKYATSALTWAARAGDVASSAALLRAGADANNAGMYCWTPLLQATHGNHFEIVQMLLEHKPNVNALDKDGCTALAIACKEGFYDISLALINSGAYINVQDHSKDTPLIYAVKGGYKNIVEALLKKHVDVDLPGKEKKTPVYTAVEKGHLAILKLLLASNPDLEHCTNSGDTALLRAVRSRNAEVVSLLLERRARVAAADNRGDTSLHVAMRARSKQIVEILLRNPKNSQLLYKPNKNKETPYNIDMSYNKTILGQIFGARKLNTNEDNENMLGYELYSAALADMLSEPSLSVPITVGLYARWGSGKSFLLNKLKEEMKNFARQWRETGWAWSWAVSWGTWHVALFVAACVAVAGVEPYIALAVLFALFAALYMTFYLLWYLGNKYEWWWADGIVAALGRKFGSLLLLLQVMFCHPPGPEDPRALPATPIRFHFTEGMKNGAGQEGEAMVVQMIGSLAEALECQYGRVCTRLARAFRPRPVSSTSGWKWRRACCIPHIITFELSFMCVLVSICVLIIFLTDKDPSRRDVPQGLVVGVCAAAGAVLLANLYAGARAVAALALPPRARLARLARAIRKDRSHALALRPEVQALTHTVSCLDAFTGQQTRLVLVVDALDSCEQEKVLALLNAVHALCSDPKSPFILLLAIDPHIISKVAWMEAVEMNSRRAFSESNIGGWDYLRNMVQLPFYLQNSALRRVKLAQQTATKRIQALGTDDFSTSLQRSVSARRLSSTSELMSSQERIKGGARPEVRETRADRAPRLRPSESVASSVASGLHRVPAPAGGAADLGRVLLTDDYFSDVNPRSMRRLMNVLYVTGRLLKAFQIEFNWYQLASWVNLTEQWPFRTSWIIYHHETYEDHIDDSTSLKHIYEKVKPSIGGLREAITLMELDRDERKLDVFLSFHRATLTAADLKIFLPFTINLDPYIKKVIKEEQVQAGAEDDIGAGAATAVSWGITPNARQTHPKPLHKKQFAQKPPPVPQPAQNNAPGQPMWVGWANPLITTAQTYSNNIPADCPVPQIVPVVAINPVTMLRTAFPGMSELSSLRLSTLSVERVCRLVHTALGMGGVAAAAALQRHRVCGLVLSVCHLNDLKPILELPFGDWELFKMLVLNLRELESGMPINTSAVTVITEKSSETETDTIKPRSTLEHQRTRPSNVEKQVTLEEQMICGALQTLNEEAMEDVLQSEPTAPSDEAGEPRAPSVSFNVENEQDDDGHITFTARPRARRAVARPRPSSLRLADDTPDAADHAPRLAARSLSVEDSTRNGSPILDLKLRNLRRTADILRKVGSTERLTRFKDKIMSRGPGSRERSPTRDETASDDESVPLVSSPAVAPCPAVGPPPLNSPGHARPAAGAPIARPLGIECADRSPQDGTASTDFSPRSEITDAGSPRGSAPDFDLLPEGKGEGRAAIRAHFAREASDTSLSNMVEPYNMRLLAHGASDGSRGLWRQDALDSLDSGPPWPPHEPDSAV
ncbi:kinase D-interacting substrate of 220 kDa B isoform X3 [Pararge aegeria]|uniref:kinase D-interacting substrate of 220 kDa B isoform X3 n=1 Tax=Pararge aegeria TaxID=116150 RepID=UPI0019D17F72|nr:kinase D-interacting substrate of 220 kDa B isoform X3 [Pararge aegeria]